MSKVILSLYLGLALGFMGSTVKAEEPLLIGFISNESQGFYENVVKPYWNQINQVSSVNLVSLTPFNDKGEVDLKQLALNIENAPASMRTIYVHWNEKYDPRHEIWLEALRRKVDGGTRVAFFAGMAKPGTITFSLSETLAAHVPKALILGELVGNERLSPQHFYGPELFSAFKTDAVAAGLTPLHFVDLWTIKSQNQDLDDSLSELRRKKRKARRMWPTVEYFFGR